jgi:hypothetical protein
MSGRGIPRARARKKATLKINWIKVKTFLFHRHRRRHCTTSKVAVTSNDDCKRRNGYCHAIAAADALMAAATVSASTQI